MENLDAKIIAALIAAVASLIVSILGAIWGRRNQRDLETLKSELAEDRAERDARRDYIYDARKRLYEECEPLFFQANEAAENTLHRILSLARTSRAGHLGFGKESWLSNDYYLTSTFYKLLVPLAIFKLILRRMTLVDLTVDPFVKARYDLMKWLYLSYTDDFEFARGQPKLPYSPLVENWNRLRQDNPQQYWRQGIPYGLLDNAVESLIVHQKSEPPRCMSFGEFEKAYFKRDSETYAAFELVREIFEGFHPRTRPVLWRILIAQAHICQALIEGGRMDRASGETTFYSLRLMNEDERKRFDWREKDEPVSQDEVFQPFLVAAVYFEEHLSELMSRPGDR